jgi:hypothetical protein
MDAPRRQELPPLEQVELPLAPDPARCPRCGRPWASLLDANGADLAALMALAPEERLGFARCWTGNCGEARS